MATPDLDAKSLKESLDLCERENDKARRIILWCGQQLPPDLRRELIARVKAEISVTMEEDDREQVRQILKYLTPLLACLDEGIAMDDDPPAMWWAKVDALAGQIRGLVNDLDLAPTLYELRADKL